MDGDSKDREMQIHPKIEPVSYLLGRWRGEGEGLYPTINSFKYGEELTFSHTAGKPVISYTQKTWKLSTGDPMHAESGYWRPKLDGTIEFVIAQSIGLLELQVPYTLSINKNHNEFASFFIHSIPCSIK